MMMTEMFLIAVVESDLEKFRSPTTAPTTTDETTTATDTGGKELRANVNLRPLLCSESECVCVCACVRACVRACVLACVRA